MKPAPKALDQKLLVVEDDPSILLGLEEILRGEGFKVSSCSRGDEAVAAVRKHAPDLIILDVMLPGKSGFDVCKELRAQSCRTPILMLTAKGQELDKVIGLDLGADDYLTKPFGVRELVARLRALLRRVAPGANGEQAFTIGGCTIDPRTFELRRGPAVDALTAKELKLLQVLHTHAGEVLTRDRLLNDVWGYGYFGTTRTLDQTIAQLRRKLGEGNPPRLLLTVHGVGYKLAAAK